MAGPGSSAGEALASHPDVDKIAFTGSTVVGRRIMQLASGTIKKVTLELGGKSPNIILDDADLDIAVPGSLFAFLMHNGGFYMEPTIFTDVRNDMRIAQEEIFGPVLSVIKYRDVDEAIRIANDTIYGLAGGVWTKDVAKGIEVASKIRAGTVWVNDWHILRNDSPFGGYKQSGIGRELGHHVLEEYSEIKTLHVSYTLDRPHKFWYDRIVNLGA